MAWLFLLVAGLMELVWAAALKESDGMTRLWPTVIGLSVALLSVVVLSVSLRTLPVGTAYAVFVGLGAAGVAAVGMVAFGESTAPARLLFLALILVGVAGLQLTEGS
ncbi:DMT family transporter [Actinomadura madurae]|uniref:DMT family transporter n=1 Tax=Actinomadura madurae TaxID=1993 RepID=UPI0020266D2B|nr:multidrug efflux SMR transporter [Actinomadura madurae]MCP9948356.1 multidrug efflux SMR transporter [Actinomadura madurae]MCP9977619.1 multidrug efflux SMR transporter [Actinomadura madurae]MCQ0010886.1 multidrug efflux SMR transporter [Actinomadura madurae]MCQ0013807.1 multidrug efflux SMR transporter [Actinomadura madurae]URM94003.1 multidrug efflux SMR transporter [Actinomadura madurae]